MLRYSGSDVPFTNGTTEVLSQIDDVNHYQFRLEAVHNNQGEGEIPQEGNSSAAVKLSGGEGSYQESYFDPEEGKEKTRVVPYAESYTDVAIKINNSDVQFARPEEGQSIPANMTANV